MWNFWLKMAYSSDDVTIPTWKEWALMGDKLKYDNKDTYVIDLNTTTTIEIITEENQKKVMGTIMGGGAGLLLLGPLGAIGGLLLGGNKKLVNIAVAFNDGRNFVATCTTRTHLSLLQYTGKGVAPLPPVTETASIPVKKSTLSGGTKECPMCAETIKAKAKICRFCKHEFDLEADAAKDKAAKAKAAKARADKAKMAKEKAAKAKADKLKVQKEIADKKKAVADKKRTEKEHIAKYKASKTWEHNIVTEALEIPAEESETPFYQIKETRNKHHAIKNSDGEFFANHVCSALKDKGLECCTSGANLLAMLTITENIHNIATTTPITLLSAINNSTEKLSNKTTRKAVDRETILTIVKRSVRSSVGYVEYGKFMYPEMHTLKELGFVEKFFSKKYKQQDIFVDALSEGLQVYFPKNAKKIIGKGLVDFLSSKDKEATVENIRTMLYELSNNG